MELDDKLCYCFHVTKRKVVNHIRVHRPQVASQLSECGGAGTGCGWCVPFLKQCFEADSNTEAAEITLTAEEYEVQRAAYRETGKR
ncbi:MAG: (2Fe-2S)-binding protein [Fuerstiella sp.]|nr:(2Fe-2S)-binding protein [Fuerstiella sp.]MCP4509588.1 (2Fe-2S)-binding protein [Fuerstiella sp.]MDG2127275.1 (2Fe-2S)-binding protein [Fuerstiella sp.]